jgi:hypothetical protein
VRWLDYTDERLRAVSQSLLFWMGGRFGCTRAVVTRNTAILFVFVPTVSTVSMFSRAPLSGSLTVISVLFINAYLGAIAYIRGTALLRGSEQWGAYTNWMEWRWLRRVELFLFPVTLVMTAAEVSDGELWELADLLRPVLLLFMLYSLTVNELPPRKPRARTAPQGSRVGAH